MGSQLGDEKVKCAVSVALEGCVTVGCWAQLAQSRPQSQAMAFPSGAIMSSPLPTAEEAGARGARVSP